MHELLTAIFATLWSVAEAPVAPVPPPVEQQTAECRNPVFATDQLVCGEPVLRQLDEQLVYQLLSFHAQSSRWLESQEQWFLRRSRCAFQTDHAGCTSSAYAERLSVVRILQPDALLLAAKCSDLNVSQIAIERDRIVLLDKQHSNVGVVPNFEVLGGWEMYLKASRSGSKLTVQSLGSDVLKCKTSPISNGSRRQVHD